jgi:hypothetical protein
MARRYDPNPLNVASAGQDGLDLLFLVCSGNRPVRPFPTKSVELERFFGQLPLTQKIVSKINGLAMTLMSD